MTFRRHILLLATNNAFFTTALDETCADVGAADIFLNTSLHEGMPGAVMEAMAAGLAVIATGVPGNRALIASMRTGVLVPLNAPQVLMEAFQMLAARAELRQQLGRHAREEVQARYGCEAELQVLEELYAKVLTM